MLDNITERVAWAIMVIKTDAHLDKGINNLALAKKLGTNKDTLADYMKGKGLLKSEVVEKIIAIYRFNPLWLFKGQGEPFPGARANYPEVCGPEKYSAPGANGMAVAEKRLEYDVKIADALTMAARVLESPTSYATALYLNIQHFDRAIKAETRINQVEQNLRVMDNTITSLKLEINELKKRLEAKEDPGKKAANNE